MELELQESKEKLRRKSSEIDQLKRNLDEKIKKLQLYEDRVKTVEKRSEIQKVRNSMNVAKNSHNNTNSVFLYYFIL